MTDPYKELRRAIYTNKSEFTLFRSVLVNAVIATDIVNKELGEVRKARWEKAFDRSNEEDGSSSLTVDRKATIVIECIITASDIAHTMQHWHIYRVRASSQMGHFRCFICWSHELSSCVCRNGMQGCLKKCGKPGRRVEQTRALLSFGTRVKSASLTFTVSSSTGTVDGSTSRVVFEPRIVSYMSLCFCFLH